MSDPNLFIDDTRPFIWAVSQLNPTASEPVLDAYNVSGDPNWLFIWWNRNTDDTFLCTNNQPGGMVWKRTLLSDVTFDGSGNGISNPLAVASGGTGSKDAPNARLSLGLQVNSNCGYAAVASPAFSTPFTFSATNDGSILGTFQMVTGVLGGDVKVTAEVDSGSGFGAVGAIQITGISITNAQTLSFIVPAGAQYQFTASNSGDSTAPTISSVMALSL